MEQLVAELEFAAAVEHVADLEGLDVIVRARLEAGLAFLVENLEGAVGVVAGDLADRHIGVGVDIALARRRIFAFGGGRHVHLPHRGRRMLGFDMIFRLRHSRHYGAFRPRGQCEARLGRPPRGLLESRDRARPRRARCRRPASPPHRAQRRARHGIPAGPRRGGRAARRRRHHARRRRDGAGRRGRPSRCPRSRRARRSAWCGSPGISATATPTCRSSATGSASGAIMCWRRWCAGLGAEVDADRGAVRSGRRARHGHAWHDHGDEPARPRSTA